MDDEATGAQRVRDLVAVAVDRGRPGLGALERGRTRRCQVEVGAQVLDPDRGGLLGPQLGRVERAEDDDLSPCAGDGDVQSALTAAAVEGPEVERQVTPFVDAEGGREEDDVSFVTLHVLEVLDEQALGVGAVERLDQSVVATVADQGLDVGALLLVERDHADGRRRATIRSHPTSDLGHNRFCLNGVGTQQLALARAVELALHADQVDTMTVDRRARGAGGRCREGREPAVVVVRVAERDERLVLAAVVPRQPALGHPSLDALGENALFVLDGERLVGHLVLVRARRGLGEGRGRHLLAVADHHDRRGPAHRPNGVSDPDLRRLVEDDQVKHVLHHGKEARE